MRGQDRLDRLSGRQRTHGPAAVHPQVEVELGGIGDGDLLLPGQAWFRLAQASAQHFGIAVQSPPQGSHPSPRNSIIGGNAVG